MAEEEGRGGVEEGGPGGAFQVFVDMENLLDKLKLLNYEDSFCRQLSFKPFSRYRVLQGLQATPLISLVLV